MFPALRTLGLRALVALGALLLFAASLALNTRTNRFPYFRHPDEPDKAQQILDGEWNYHHPMLLLATTKLCVELTGVPRNAQAIVETGRWVSAAFVAGAVTALALLAWLWRGWVAGLAAGAALLLHHQLFELAHYMKEDSALLLGLALTGLAAFAYDRRPSTAGALGLGLAAGLAISGKYLGILALGLALPPLVQTPAGSRARRLAIFAAATIAIFALVNLPMLTQLATFRQSVGREMELVVHGQAGLTRRVPHAQYWNIFIDNTTPAIWLLLAVFLVARWRERRSLSLTERLLIGFPFAFALALSFSPKSNDRYFLPATAFFTLLAALGVVDAARLLPGRTRTVLALAATLLVAGQAPSLLRYWRAFQHDDTAELIDWLRAARDVPPDATIAKDSRVGLPDPQKKKDAARAGAIPQKVIAARSAADLGTLEELRAQGVTHVAISESDYGRYFLRSLSPQRGGEADFARRKAFYEELLRAAPPLRLLFARDRGTVIYLHPGIRVYRITTE